MRYDAIEVDINELTVKVMARDLNESSAERIVEMAVTRRGVEKHFFAAVLMDLYKDGDIYRGPNG